VAEADRELVRRAVAKKQEGWQPSREEAAALRRFERETEERKRWEYYRTIPQKHWREMSGRQTKVIAEQASRYGLPFDGPFVCLPDLARALHDFLAANARRLAADPDDPFADDSDSPALERWRAAKADLADLDLAERRRQLVPREQIHTLLGQIANLLRSAGDDLQRHHGPDAHAILDEALDDAAQLIAQLDDAPVPEGPKPANTPPPEAPPAPGRRVKKKTAAKPKPRKKT